MDSTLVIFWLLIQSVFELSDAHSSLKMNSAECVQKRALGIVLDHFHHNLALFSKNAAMAGICHHSTNA